MGSRKVITTVILVLSFVCLASAWRPPSEEALSGWALFEGTQDKVPHLPAKEGYYYIRIELQIQNTSSETRFLNLGLIQLRDEDGFVHPCRNPWITELSSTFDFLLPGEVFWHTLMFEAPLGAVPALVILNFGLWDSIPSQRIPLISSPPPELLRQRLTYSLPGDAAFLCDLRWSIDSVTLARESEELELIITVENQTTSIVEFGPECAFRAPFLKDAFGRIAGLAEGFDFWTGVPGDLRPGEYFKMRCAFDIASLEAPVYFCVKSGQFLSDAEGIIWLVVPD